MQNGYYQATGAMVTQFNRLDVISNNLANLNTNAFKRDDVVIGDFNRIFQETKDELPLSNHTKEAAKFINRNIDRVPQISEQYVVFSQAGLKETTNPLDFAFKRDDLFFMVETPNGVRLTQNGALSLDQNGTLVTKEGYPVLPANFFENGQYIVLEDELPISSDSDGNIYYGDDAVGTLFLAQVEDMRRLTKEGDSLYMYDEQTRVTNLANSNGLLSGFLESSNVNPVTEMVNLIEANRMVEMYQKVMTSHMDDLNNEAISKLANSKA